MNISYICSGLEIRSDIKSLIVDHLNPVMESHHSWFYDSEECVSHLKDYDVHLEFKLNGIPASVKPLYIELEKDE